MGTTRLSRRTAMIRVALALVGCSAIAPIALGQDSGNAAAGKLLADEWQCIECHGPDGNGNKGILRFELGEIPRISAQPQTYFIKSMHDYRDGKRPENDMQVLVEQLTEDDIRNLAAWYGSQTPRAEATYDYNPNR
jgi:cytochrome c553